jgi:hypothetical protein
MKPIVIIKGAPFMKTGEKGSRIEEGLYKTGASSPPCAAYSCQHISSVRLISEDNLQQSEPSGSQTSFRIVKGLE